MEKPQIELRTLNSCTFDEALALWNGGFSGYYSDMSRTLPAHTAYLGQASIQPQLSVAAFIAGKPAGFVLIGMREIHGRKSAWNAGTGVLPEFRGLGIAKTLMQETVRRLREEGVHTAALEVVTKNAGAIAAYEHAGFRKTDELIGLRREGAFAQIPFPRSGKAEYTCRKGNPAEVAGLSFYRENIPWMSQWYNWTGGEAIIIHDRSGHAAGYALRRCHYGDHGGLASVELSHCEAAPNREDAGDVVRFALSCAFGPFDAAIVRSTSNLPQSSKLAVQALLEAGFTTVYEQYLMMAEL
ncbi:GNAT family N-acetyltransferase [Paenibacillus mendelii]|uniref:GNAT family N-acetyltransferase n=1 Tax=Paenibacillus mendelii TaxID=206163 RepID=A0ABV6JLX8_9BACL|nr:GNAT family N-acetyltransferase [Paenibacillus mendelii]MCQ6560641.1 GNAT family N-acetyltransferase [Paenibacillus mendelii]